ncbi:deoxyribose-phosphate aldolase [Bacillaceae bacterium Marseille-Q3522]|nr:deoxyribose-phosphate aldolase [Bacillaceae bacterium Marseille-Q3522]
MTNLNFAQYIDHTLLKAGSKLEDIKNLCKEAIKYNFASVCINPRFVKTAAKLLKDTPVKVCTVAGFPLGANATEVKAFETKTAIKDGASEIDMVIAIGAAKDHDWKYVEEDIRAVQKEITDPVILKVIIETCLLSQEEKLMVCQICRNLNVDFVKTSTGFSTGGATVEDVKLMDDIVGPKVKVKASGGIKNYTAAKAMIEAGAKRLGTSNGTSIIFK